MDATHGSGSSLLRQPRAVWAVAFAWIFISLLMIGIRKKGLPMWPTNPKFIYGFFAVLFVFGVLRNIPAWPLTILYP